jgi:methylenetetrahydrofolate reductase (NADPH)
MESQFANKLGSSDFIITAEHAPGPTATGAVTEAALKALGGKLAAVNIGDNQHGVAMSSLAACVIAMKSGAEPILQMVTRDRNRIALQSDLLGAASLGVKNILCLSGYHQTLINCPDSSNVYDIDSTQFIELVNHMSEKGLLADGTKINGQFGMLIGAVANPFLRPIELNLLRYGQKIAAGAKFFQTHPVFDVKAFAQWFEAVQKAGLDKKAAVIASVCPLQSLAEAEKLRGTFSDYVIPDEIVARLKSAGDEAAQKKQGLAICAEIMKQLKGIKGLKGIHILSGGKETQVPELLTAAGM